MENEEKHEEEESKLMKTINRVFGKLVKAKKPGVLGRGREAEEFVNNPENWR